MLHRTRVYHFSRWISPEMPHCHAVVRSKSAGPQKGLPWRARWLDESLQGKTTFTKLVLSWDFAFPTGLTNKMAARTVLSRMCYMCWASHSPQKSQYNNLCHLLHLSQPGWQASYRQKVIGSGAYWHKGHCSETTSIHMQAQPIYHWKLRWR